MTSRQLIFGSLYYQIARLTQDNGFLVWVPVCDGIVVVQAILVGGELIKIN